MSRDTLADLRVEIDAADAALMALLEKRFRIVDRVIVVKQRDGLPAVIPARIEEVVANAKARATDAKVPPALAEQLWRAIIAATIEYEEQAFDH